MRDRRATGYDHIPNEHFKPNEEFLSKQKLSKILAKSEEKKFHLQRFILKYIQEKKNCNTVKKMTSWKRGVCRSFWPSLKKLLW